MTDERPTAEVWEIPRRVWFILASWGMAVLVLAGLLSFWIWTNQREADRQAALVKFEQDSAMCAMTGLIISGPDPVPGPAGDRGRDIQRAMQYYRSTLQCESLRPPR